MKYNRFEQLPVWKAAIELAVGVFALTAKSEFKIYASPEEPIGAGYSFNLEQHR
jgi:hypothetical protein